MAAVAEFELLVLLAILRRDNRAYAPAVRAEIETRGSRRTSLGAVYITLDRLERKGLLTSRLGEPTAARGGRAKRFYAVTTAGMAAVKAECRLMQRMWSGLGLLPEKP